MTEYRGKTYYFCAKGCQREFLENPGKYVAAGKLKEIKAYVRPGLLETILGRLDEAGAKDITVIRVDAIGRMADFEKDREHFWRKFSEKYSQIAKLEIVCLEEKAREYMRIIKEAGRLGESGDGRIFLSDIEDALNIRTGETGDAAL
jgi:nitrogen regulatory protein P-II 1